MQKSMKKVSGWFGVYAVKQYFCTRFRERNADELKYWTKEQEFEPAASKKNWKNFEKSFGGSKISLTFASAFEKEAIKEEFFERFRYEQASSTILT